MFEKIQLVKKIRKKQQKYYLAELQKITMKDESMKN